PAPGAAPVAAPVAVPVAAPVVASASPVAAAPVAAAPIVAPVVAAEAAPEAAPAAIPVEAILAKEHVPSPDVLEAVTREPTDNGTVRVNVAVLDRLMNLIGELVLARNQMVQIAKSFRDTHVGAQAAGQRLSLVTSDLQEQIMKTRMQPVARVFEKIPRMVRDLCRDTHKQVTSHIDGNNTEIDKALVEAIRDPVMHIVRNALDHGVETPAQRLAVGKPATGKLSVRAAHEGGMVTIEVEDDGRCMDPRKLRAHAVKKGLMSAAAADEISDRAALDLVFLPGFSTAEKITDISGRGVGMDVVRTHVERAGGKVELDSTLGKGTTIRLKMPLTLAIIPALLVRSGGQRFAIPQVNLLELVYLNEDQAKTSIEHVRGAAIYRLRGEILPLVRLNHVLKLPVSPASDVNIVVVAVGARRYGLIVDEIHDTEEIVIKPLHGQLKRLACYSGATVLGDGGVALILEVTGVAGMAGIDVSTRRGVELVTAATTQGSGSQPCIVFIAGDGTQCAVPLAMVARLEQIPSNTIERVAGAEVVQYRKAIMPIVRPEAVIQLGTSREILAEQPLVVFDFGQMVGMAVNAIVDVVDIENDLAQAEGKGRFTLGRTVVLGKTTLLLDVYSIVRELAPQFVQERRKGVRRPKVLLIDDSSAMRSALGGFLRASGMDVVDVASGELALTELKSAPGKRFDAVITDLEMEGMNGFDVIRAVAQVDDGMPVFVWTYHDDTDLEERVRAAGARACVNKLKREQLIGALQTEGILLDRRSSDRSAA
ncbi:MAG: hybrid sensor histidine kinase/response regulator, partial [Proteobacteria bacterium]|nr:hybrid sensor histidine kinase/response regulator [Pseudomonadota bacterium]